MNEYIFFGAVAALIVGIGIYSIIRNSKTRKNGVEADAIVSRIEEDGTASSEGGADYTDIYCVTSQIRTDRPLKQDSTASRVTPAWATPCELSIFLKSRILR